MMKHTIYVALLLAVLGLAAVLLIQGATRPHPAAAETPAVGTSGIPDKYFRRHTPTVLEWDVNSLAPAMLQFGEAGGCRYYGYNINQNTGEVLFIFMVLQGQFDRELLAECVTNAFHGRLEEYPLKSATITVTNLTDEKTFGCSMADRKWTEIKK
jgi:hypothetical protein